MSNHIKNYLPLSRKFFKHELWKEGREYSPAEAWLWLLKEAKYKPGSEIIHKNGRRIKIHRTQLTASFRDLQSVWGWGSICRVQTFLSILKEENMITVDSSQGQNVITLTNYPKYNPSFSDPETKNGSPPLPQGEGRDEGEKSRGVSDKGSDREPADNPRPGTETTRELIAYWNACNGTNFRAVSSRVPQVRQRLKTFSIKELKTAIKNRSVDDWVQKNNQNSNWDALFKNDKQVETWLERTPKRGGTTAEAMTRAEAEKHAKKHGKPFKPPFYEKSEEGYVAMFS